ncbi:MAG TPA: hypothetical protein QGH10_26960, partial [Armatimonadota bacterium]|nr:hypothetical protein [Armatimonadota bacterium]
VGALLLFVFLPLAIVYHGVRIPLDAKTQVFSGAIALAIWLALAGLDRAADAALLAPARSLALVMACLFFGMFASRVIRDRNLLVPACSGAAVADILSVGWGFTGRALEHAPVLVTKLSVAVPTMALAPVAAGHPQYPLVATLGAGDIFFIGLFFAAAARFGLPMKKTFVFVYPLVVLALAMAVFDVIPWIGIPGLPFICAGFLAANTRAFSLSRDEWRALGAVAVLVVIAMVALFVIRGLSS